jgi:hypothetical protein
LIRHLDARSRIRDVGMGMGIEGTGWPNLGRIEALLFVIQKKKSDTARAESSMQ